MFPLILTLSCEDRKGIVAAISGFLAQHSCNILESAQFLDVASGRFFMRTVFHDQEAQGVDTLKASFDPVAQDFAMEWHLHDTARKANVLIMVSKLDHCLQELLYQQKCQVLPMQVLAIVSNHQLLKPLADFYGIPYYYLPVTRQTKMEQEQAVYTLIKELNIDLVVLARYMQILSDGLCAKLEGRIINIHHSFLPSFKGARPYHQAQQRGVKIIGATAHYVTKDLDEGPIIEQETTRITHAHTPEAMIEEGKHLESVVLKRAVKYHLEHRVLLNGHKTIIF